MRRRTLLRMLPALGLGLAGCTQEPAPAPAPTFRHTVDLSHVVRQDVPYLSAEPPTRIERHADGRVRQLQIGARTGTLLEVIAAADAGLRTVDRLSPQDLAVPAAVIDVRDQAQDRPGYRLGAAEIAAWERRHGPIPAGALVLLATGWDVRWGDPAAYLSLDGAGQPTAPAFGTAAAAALLDERGAGGLGIDAPGGSYAPASGHRLLLANLTSLEQLPPTGATIIIGALKLQAAQSSPARVIALIP